MKRTTTPTQDDVVTAVRSRASNAGPVKRLVSQFMAATGDPYEAGFEEVACGGFVSRTALRTIYQIYDELWPLEGRVSGRRLQALEDGAKLTSVEKALYTKRKLEAYFAEPVEGAFYAIAAVTSSSGRTAYWTEIREGDSWEGVRRETVGIFSSVTAARAALRRKGLISVRDYRPTVTRGTKSQPGR